MFALIPEDNKYFVFAAILFVNLLFFILARVSYTDIQFGGKIGIELKCRRDKFYLPCRTLRANDNRLTFKVYCAVIQIIQRAFVPRAGVHVE